MEKKRSAITCALLSLPAPGLGHIYCGRLAWGVLFLLLSFAHWGVFIFLWVVVHSSLQPALMAWMATSALVWVGAVSHAVVTARHSADGFERKPYNLWYLYLLVALLSWSAHYGIFRLLGANWLTAVELKSDGMIPGLLMGDTVRVDLRSDSVKNIKKAMVVAVVDPYDGQTWRVLRVVGMAGDDVQLTDTGLVINQKHVDSKAGEFGEYVRKDQAGQWVEQKFARFKERLDSVEYTVAQWIDPSRRRRGKWKVPEGKVLLLGDNRITATDSTVFGPVPLESIRGVVFKVWFSKDPRTSKRRSNRQGMDIH